MRWRPWLGSAILAVACGFASGCGPSASNHQASGSCVPPQAAVSPVTSRWIRVWTSQSITVHVGRFVGLEVIEPEAYTSTNGFPWTEPRTEGQRVLVPAQECGRTAPASLPLAVYYFRAIAAGTERVTVPLSPTWLRRGPSCIDTASCVPLRPLVVTVSVGEVPHRRRSSTQMKPPVSDGASASAYG